MARMKIDLQITSSDGATEQVVAGPADMIALERHYNISTGSMQDPTASRIEYLAYLAWSALRRTRAGVPDFDAWLATLDDLESSKAADPAGNAEAEQPT